MNSQTLRLVLMVSMAHAMVHVYEHALPSVEQLIANSYGVDERTTGALGACWRFPFGMGAFVAGWLVDRIGSKPLLILYLLGCAATSVVVYSSPSLHVLFATMFMMGLFASIYHPAGLALISHETTPANRTLALGYHGILGSVGIAAAPFLAGLFLSIPGTWQQYYLFLSLPGLLLAILFYFRLVEHHRQGHSQTNPGTLPSLEEDVHWDAFVLLIMVGISNGFIYAGLMNFLPRYLDAVRSGTSAIPQASFRNYLTGGVLFVGCAGQFLAGRFARPGKLELFLVFILLSTAPFLFWMSVAQGYSRVVAAGLFALVHFMHQPVYNSLIAEYVPGRHRSFGYGISNTLAFGIGGMGAYYAGYARTDFGETVTYSSFGAVALLATLLAVLLWWRHGQRDDE